MPVKRSSKIIRLPCQNDEFYALLQDCGCKSSGEGGTPDKSNHKYPQNSLNSKDTSSFLLVDDSRTFNLSFYYTIIKERLKVRESSTKRKLLVFFELRIWAIHTGNSHIRMRGLVKIETKVYKGMRFSCKRTSSTEK